VGRTVVGGGRDLDRLRSWPAHSSVAAALRKGALGPLVRRRACSSHVQIVLGGT
jgi:hypothetical protein